MASKLSPRLLAQLGRSTPLLTPHARHCICAPTTTPRFYSDEASPPLLAKLKGDLKTAMKAKDAPRLTVLRSVLAATLNASKTASPVQTDPQLVALLRRTARASAEAAAEFRAAGREDLATKEEAQIAVLEGYCAESGIEHVSGERIRALVEAVAVELKKQGKEGKAAMAPAMASVMSALTGKDVDRAEVTRVIKEVIVKSS